MGSENQEPSTNYLLLVLSRWKTVVAGALLCALAGFTFYFMAPVTYEASAMLLVYPPFFKIGRQESASLSDLMPRALPVETYKTIAESDDLYAEVIDTLALEDATVDTLARSCKVKLNTLGSRTPQYGTRYAGTLIFLARSKDPETAAVIAQTWADLFKKRVDGLGQAGLTGTYELLNSMWREKKRELEDAEDTLTGFRIEWNHSLAIKRINGKQESLTRFDARLIELRTRIAAEKARLDTFKGELAKENKKDVLFRAPSDDVYWLNKLADSASDGKEVNPETGLRTELLNAVYVEFREREITTMATLSGLENERLSTLAEIGILEAEIEKLQAEIAARETEKTRLERDVRTLLETFDLTAKGLEMGKVAQLSETSDIQIVARAVPGRTTAPPHLFALTVVLGGLVGALLTMGAVVVQYILTGTQLAEGAQTRED